MSRLAQHKKITAIAAIALLMAAAGAYAYWTAAGTGSASGTASSGGTITLEGTIADGIAPGLNAVVNFTANNPTSSTIRVGTVSLLAVGGVTTNVPACVVTAFTMPAVVQNEDVLAGATDDPLSGIGTLTMANTELNQDACKGAVITLHLQST